ncbi:MAG: sel1 repeat family protein, partial [Cephaloticoccus sp.]|nr:sel1 repeat family protein [Cephaloticoccus sp.]
MLLVFVGVGPVRAQENVASLQAKANTGDPVALNALGNMYANGQGVARDDAEALKRYAQSAEQAYAPANFNLGMMYELGRGVPADITKAFAYYLKAAQQGFAPAQFNVGNMYAGGLGVAQDYFEAVLWFRQAAEQGVAEAQYNLGLAYELGRGVSADAAQAQRWYGLSAQQGYARASYNLAVMLEEGRGSAKDEATAAKLYLASARQGFGPAQNNYGIMLAEGRGGLKADPVEALIWLNIAVQNGISPMGRDMVAKQVTPVQLAEANARLESMRAAAAAPTATQTPAAAPTRAPAQGDEAAGKQLAALKAENQRFLAAQQKLEQERADLGAKLQAAMAENKKLSANIDAISQAQAAAQKDPNTDPKLAYYMAENTRLNDEVTRSTKELSSLFRQLRVA